ncbi:MAG: zinc ribbon domain-containing protein [Clostridiaceae bacterium]|jgi:hypothetical protein|nr:zinc ribbon domain-containing protein [Clostridiaceae bacterium]
MLCPNCGKELPEGSGICESCGASADISQTPPEDISQTPMENFSQMPPADFIQPPSGENWPDEQSEDKTPDIYADYPLSDSAPEPEKPRKKKRLALRITAVILAAVVLITGIVVLGYYTFLPAKITLKVAQYFTLQKSWKQVDRSMARSRQLTDAFFENPLKADTRISYYLDPAALTLLGLGDISEFLAALMNDFTIQASTEVDLPNRKQNFSMSLNYLNNPTLSLNGFIDNDRIGLSMPELSKKSITGRFSDLPRLVEMYPEYLKDSGLESLAGLDPWLVSSLSREVAVESKDIRKIMQTYGMLFVNNVEGKDMSIMRGKTTGIFGEKIRCMEVAITLDQKAQLKLAEVMLDTMRDDDTLYNAMFGNLAKVLEMMFANNPALNRNMRLANIGDLFGRSQYNLLLSILKQSLNKNIFPEKAEIKVYINGLDVVKYELEIPLGTSGESFRITYENLINGNDSKTGFVLDSISAGEHVTIYMNSDKKYDEKSDTQDSSFEFGLSGIDESDIRLKISSNQDLEGSNTVRGTVDLALDYTIDNSSGGLSLKADTLHVRNKDGLPENVDLTANISLNVPSVQEEPIGLTLAFESDIQYGVEVKTPDWAGSAIDLGTASKEELDSFVNEIKQTIDAIRQLASYMTP